MKKIILIQLALLCLTSELFSQNKDFSKLINTTIDTVVFYKSPLVFKNFSLKDENEEGIKWLKAFYVNNCPPCFGDGYDDRMLNYMTDDFISQLYITKEKLITFKNSWYKEIFPQMPMKHIIVFSEFKLTAKQERIIIINYNRYEDISNYKEIEEDEMAKAKYSMGFILKEGIWKRMSVGEQLSFLKDSENNNVSLPRVNVAQKYTDTYIISTKNSEGVRNFIKQ